MRETLLKYLLLAGLFVAFTTEALSVFHALTPTLIRTTWCLFLVVSLAYTLRDPKTRISELRGCYVLASRYLHGNWSNLITTILLAVVLITTLLSGLLSAPNNWDSMSYHLPRVMHWLQNKSVSFYATHYLPQLQGSPWSEYAMLHLIALTGGDRLVFMVQWISMLGTMAAVSLLVREFGGNRRSQLFAAIFVATLPMGILQSSSTQNDYVVSFWLVNFALYSTRYIRERKFVSVIYAGVSLGLAVLTKGSAYIYAAPLAIWITVILLRNNWKSALRFIGVVGTCTLLLNTPHYVRNFKLFGDPLGMGQSGVKITNDSFGIKITASNIMRNMGLHMATPSKKIADTLQTSITKAHKLIDCDLNDPRATWPYKEFKIKNKVVLNEDLASNTAHLIVICIFLASFIFYRRLGNKILRYDLAVVSAMLLFCALLKWQPWHSRLHLPWFILCAPIVAIPLSTIGSRWIKPIQLLLIVLSLPWAFCNATRPLVANRLNGARANIFQTPRDRQYFIHKPRHWLGYERITSQILEGQWKRLGLFMPPDGWEYPFWALLRRKGGDTSITIQHVLVKNESAVYEHRNDTPDVIIALEKKHSGSIDYNGREYRVFFTQKPVSIFSLTSDGSDSNEAH